MHPRWLIVVGIITGSLIIIGSSIFIGGYFNAVGEEDASAIQQAGQRAVVDKCLKNNEIKDTVSDWCELIVHTAYQHEMDPLLIAAVIETESAGNADALSKSGAVGLMQVMPRDGIASQFQCINGPCFANRPSMSKLYDPVYNVTFGSQYLSGLIEHNDGDLREALRNYGPRDMGYTYADMVLSLYQRYQ